LTQLSHLINWLKLNDKQGVTAIEYGLIAALVGLAIVVGATALGTNLGTLFTNISGNLNVGGS
jgi:pilus assembly protein Flp/PilA